jgi:hypothetical protein
MMRHDASRETPSTAETDLKPINRDVRTLGRHSDDSLFSFHYRSSNVSLSLSFSFFHYRFFAALATSDVSPTITAS